MRARAGALSTEPPCTRLHAGPFPCSSWPRCLPCPGLSQPLARRRAPGLRELSSLVRWISSARSGASSEKRAAELIPQAAALRRRAATSTRMVSRPAAPRAREGPRRGVASTRMASRSAKVGRRKAAALIRTAALHRTLDHSRRRAAISTPTAAAFANPVTEPRPRWSIAGPREGPSASPVRSRR